MYRVFPAALAVALVLTAPLSARVAAPPPMPDRVAAVQAIVVGKVTAVEDRTVKTKDGAEYHIAVVKVEEGLMGAKDLTHVKVGFNPGGRRFPQLNLRVGQEACFFLSQMPGETFQVVRMYFHVLPKSDKADFARDIEQVRRYARALENTDAGLKSKDAGERFLAAALLIKKYRGPRYTQGKWEPLSAEESKPILEALADADWAKKDEQGLDPATVFFQLGAGPKDGYTPPGDFNQVPEAAKKWLKANAGTYRIQRWVSAE